MTVVTYPGIYIEEFTPGPPIEGVGTSTVAFVGTAEKGPVGKYVGTPAPTAPPLEEAIRLHSWDAFKETFGDFVADAPASFLAPAVFGFFVNGGTDCFVLRVTTALHARAPLNGLMNPAEPVLLVEARDEGVAGNAITVDVKHTSILETELQSAGSTAKVLTVHRAASTLSQPLTAAAANRGRVGVADNARFIVGETIVVTSTAVTAGPQAVIAAKPATGTKNLSFEEALPGTDAFAVGDTVRSVDLHAGQYEIQVEVPQGLQLARALPRGSTVLVTDQDQSTEVRTVETTTSPVNGLARIVLTEPLTRVHALAQAAPTVASLEFNLTVSRPPKPGQASEQPFPRLSMNPDHPRYWGTIVTSDWVSVREPATPPANPAKDPRPAVATSTLVKGEDDRRDLARAGLETRTSDVLAVLDAEDELDVICIPGATKDTVQRTLQAYCERTRRFGILDSVRGTEPTDAGIIGQADTVRSEEGYVALYYPWVRAQNPRTGRIELWPPSGHVAGVYARTDARVGVHAAPANATLRGTLGLERRLTNVVQGQLNLQGVNALRVFPGQATPVVWGARTTGLQNKYWQYINIRRLFLYIENSIELNIQWAVFQPNNLALWQQLRRVLTDFLTKLWQAGALFGATAKEAFYVRIDEALNPESERALGRLHIEIGIAPTYPAEFIVVRIGIWRGGSDVSEA